MPVPQPSPKSFRLIIEKLTSGIIDHCALASIHKTNEKRNNIP